MYKVERQSKTKLQVINDSIVSASVGYKNVYLFGIKLYSKTFNEYYLLDFSFVSRNRKSYRLKRL